jgi:DNA-binding transcriptional LysR family regulator
MPARYRVASTLNALALAATGLAIALVPEPLANVAIPGLVYRPLSERDVTADLLRLSRASETDAAVRAFLAVARERDAERPQRPSTRTSG